MNIPVFVVRCQHNVDGGWFQYSCPNIAEAWWLMNRLIDKRIAEGAWVDRNIVQDSVGNDVAQVHINRADSHKPTETYWLAVDTTDQQ